MKQLLIGLVVLGCFVAVPFASARDANRESLQREWMSMNAQQTQQTAAKTLNFGMIYDTGKINVSPRQGTAFRRSHHSH